MTDAQEQKLDKAIETFVEGSKTLDKLVLFVCGDPSSKAKGLMERLDEHHEDDKKGFAESTLQNQTVNKRVDDVDKKVEGYVNKGKGILWVMGIFSGFITLACVVITVIYALKPEKISAETLQKEVHKQVENARPVIYISKENIDTLAKILRNYK